MSGQLIDCRNEWTTRNIAIPALATRTFLVGHQPDRYHVLFLISRAILDSYKDPVISMTDQHVRSYKHGSIHQEPIYLVRESYVSFREARSVDNRV